MCIICMNTYIHRFISMYIQIQPCMTGNAFASLFCLNQVCVYICVCIYTYVYVYVYVSI